MNYSAHGLTDIGRVRKKNEDSILLDQDLGVFIVCDGMGGHAAGDVASRTACTIVHDYLSANANALKVYAEKPTVPRRAAALGICDSAIVYACREINRLAREDLAARGMGTTCVLLVLAGRNALLAHVGDSRAYMIRMGRIYQMTEDHSLGVEGLRKGTVTPEDATSRSMRSVLTRSVGFQESVQVDTLSFEVMPGDTFVLCTDGLSQYFEARQLLDAVSAFAPGEAPQKLIDLANSRGGKDNISCILVRAEGRPDPEALHADRKIEALRQIPLFADLDYLDLIKLLNILSVRGYKAGDRVIAEGEPSDRLYVVLAGEVEVSKGRKKLSRLGEGAFFGEMGLIDCGPRSADVTALEPTRLLVLPFKDFRSLLDRECRMALKVLWAFCEVLNTRLRSTSREATGASEPGKP